MPYYRSAAVSVSLLALALAGCSKSSQDLTATSGLPALPAACPMQTGPATAITTAPPASALPAPRQYVGVSRFANDSQAYAYLDRAADTEDEIGDAPPDYDYDYDGGVRPWVWETGNGDYQYAEPIDGGYRYYYYQPGQDYPYLIRTHDYTYAFAGGALVAMYGLNGALLPPEQYGRYRDQASRFFWRGQQMRQAANQQPHQGVYAANWAARRPEISAAQASWAQARTQQPAWQAYHAQNDPTKQPGWQQEHQQRQQVAQQFDGWQSHGFSGPAPKALAVAGPRAIARQPSLANAPANGHPAAVAGQPGLAGPEQSRGARDGEPHGAAPLANGAAPLANGAAPATAHDHQAGHAEGQRRASQQQEAAARQQQVANVHSQQANVAQEHVAAQQHAQQHLAVKAAQQAQLHALAAQHHAETARTQASHAEAQAAVHQHAEAARPEAPRPAAQHAPEARPAEMREAPRSAPAHPEAARPAPGHENEHHDH